MASKTRRQKIRRLKSGSAPRVLDLFAGCGGLSLGFQSAGFQIVAAIENDPLAASSHALNFFKKPSERALHCRAIDITESDPRVFLTELNLGRSENAIDVIIGGPPCQAFARVGRAKLREVAAHPEAFLKDPRSDLYLRYLQYVAQLHPVVLVIENVPDVLNYGGHNIAEEICETLTPLGYTCGYTLLNSVFYGVPQMRERMFLIAYADELNAKIEFPKPTNWVELPRGYEGTRQVALKHLHDLFNRFYVGAPVAKQSLDPAITAKEALKDLPPITVHLEGKLKRGARRFNEYTEYVEGLKPSKYARLMREWKGFASNGGVTDHVIRSLPRDYPIFRRMHPGDQYPEAYKHAVRLLEERLDELAKQGIKLRKGSSEYDSLRKQIVPPYDAGKFPNKWRKMESDRPARTLMAHLGKDSYSHIHYDSEQARTISVREAARLQSFPDGFAFAGTMNPAFRQIGNAVPPLLAKAIAEEIMKQIRG